MRAAAWAGAGRRLWPQDPLVRGWKGPARAVLRVLLGQKTVHCGQPGARLRRLRDLGVESKVTVRPGRVCRPRERAWEGCGLRALFSCAAEASLLGDVINLCDIGFARL